MVKKIEKFSECSVFMWAMAIANPIYIDRVILIFEGAIFSPWNHPFYCWFRRAYFKTVFVFKIEPILVIHNKVQPP